MPAPASPPRSASTTTTPPATSRTRGASTAGSAATGSCSAGSRRACRGRTAPSRTACRSSPAGRSSTTCGAARRDRPAPLPRRGVDRASRLAAALDALGLARSPRRGSSRSCSRRSARRWTSRGGPTTPAVGRDAVTSAQQVALAIAFLPHQAWLSADAIVRTLWRLLVEAAEPARVADRLDGGAAVSGSGRGVWRRCGRPRRSPGLPRCWCRSGPRAASRCGSSRSRGSAAGALARLARDRPCAQLVRHAARSGR
jgi:hypothetical protein